MTEASVLKRSKAAINPTSRLTAAVARALREGTLLVFGAIALVLLLALFSFHTQDPFYFDTGAPPDADGPHAIANWIGPAGAWVAGALVYLFGRPAYLFPLMLAYAGWLVHKEKFMPDPRMRVNTMLRTAGFALTLLTSCGLATLNWSPYVVQKSPQVLLTAGGVLGEWVGTGGGKNLGGIGANLLLLGLWFAGVALFLGVSWFQVMDRLGAAVLRSIDWTITYFEQRRELTSGQQRKQARQGVVREEQKKAAARPPPRIEASPPAIQKSERIERERQVPLFDAPSSNELPALSLLDEPGPREQSYSDEALEAMSRLLEIKLRDFGVEAEVVAVLPGPVITRFELRPAPGVKVSQISNLSKDLARALSTISVRVVEIIPGKSVIGMEIPNEKREIVTLGEIIKSKPYDDVASPLAIALGKDIGGIPVVADLARMPHLLIAGTTGSGKSVGINAMVATPEHVRMIMIDPKMLELSVYEGIPHLLSPVVTDMKQAANALRWCVAEMERRYQLMSMLGVRNIGGFNRKVKDAADAGNPIKDPIRMQKIVQGVPGVAAEDVPDLTAIPFIVVVIDELADLMMIVGKKVEELIARLAQKARAAGIHLILATQRPSVDVITGLIKANIPTRIAFQVSAKVDSRTILDQSGAESLLGNGDMLYLPPGTSIPTRVHGAFVSDQEVHRVVAALKAASPPVYIDEILEGPRTAIPGFPSDDEDGEGGTVDAEADPLYDEAVRIVTETRKASISGVQRRLKIGYNRAARLVEAMEAAGLVGPLQSNGGREIFGAAPPQD